MFPNVELKICLVEEMIDAFQSRDATTGTVAVLIAPPLFLYPI